MKEGTFPKFTDVDGVLSNDCKSTRGGIMTIKPPGYTLAVTNPTDETPSTTLIPTEGPPPG
jgi:hypothetical protein